MSESIGIREGWIEKGWTEEQMMDRIKELNLPVPWCSYQPYVLNFLQTPDMNQKTLQRIEETREIAEKEGSNAWIAASNLWPPNKPINIVFSSSSYQDFIKATLMKYLQPHISMQLTFSSGSSGDVMINVVSLAGQGGNSAVGRTGKQQTVNLGSANMNGADVNNTAKFHWPRYTVLHEFGHCLGLWHEWNREMCGRNGVTCSGTQDSYSVMNYPVGSSGGSSDAKPSPNCMDNYSPTDIEWLEKVYGKGPGGSTNKPSTQPPPGKTQQPKPQPPGKTQQPKPQSPGKTQQPKPQPPPPIITQPKPPPPIITQPKPPPPVITPSKPPSTTTQPPTTTQPSTLTTQPSTLTTQPSSNSTTSLSTDSTMQPSTQAPNVQNINLYGANLNMIIIIVVVSSIIFLGILVAIVKFSKKN